jgi:S1-C subfamily serine protease
VGDEDSMLPSLPDDLGGDKNLKITLGLPTTEEEDVKNKKTDDLSLHLPDLPGGMGSSSTTTTRKVNKPRFKKSHLKIVSACLLLVAVILVSYSLKEDDNANQVVLTEPATSIKVPIITSTVTSSTVITPVVGAEKNIDIENLMRSVVLIHAFSSNEFPCLFDSTGSGTIVLDGSYILTNYHVIVDDSFSSNPNYCELEVYITESAKELPQFFSTAEVVKTAVDKKHDLAAIKLTEGRLPERAIEMKDNELQIGEEVNLIGYPGMGGFTITYTSGEVSGWDNCEIVFDDCDFKGAFYKTSAKMGPGVSGGAGFSSEGEFIGIPTAVSAEEIGDNLGLVRPTSYAVKLLEKINK